MAQRRFGPTRAAGVVILEKQSQPSIIPGALGSTAYTGIMQKGPIGKAFLCSNRRDFEFKAGFRIPESLLPDAAFSFYTNSQGAGAVYGNRVTDGTEKISELILQNRRDPKSDAITFKAGNAGRWAGKKQVHIDEYSSVTATTLQMDNVPAGLEEDELVDGLVALAAVPGKSFKIISNTSAGLFTFAADVDLVTEIGASADLLYSVTLNNDGQAIGVKLLEGTDNPTTEWKLEVYFIEGGISSLVKTYDNLSSDPSAGNYFLKVVNEDSQADFLVKLEDEYTGSITADVRPANYAGKSLGLTSTTLTVKISSEDTASATSGVKFETRSLTPGAEAIEDTVTLTNTAPGTRSDGTFTQSGQPADSETIEVAGETITFKTVVADADSEVLIGGSAEATLDNVLAFINAKSLQIGHGLYTKVFAEKDSATVLHIYAMTAGTAGDAFSLVSSAASWTPSGATLSGGVDQTWTYASAKMPFITGEVVTGGVAYVGVNDFATGFTLIDFTRDSTKAVIAAETVTLNIRPLEVGKLVGGFLLPDEADFRTKFEIVSNDADTITVKSGSVMTDDAAAGDTFRVEYVQELRAGYDGVAGITDSDYQNAYDVDNSALKQLRGQNLGLVRLATPGVTSTAVQKAMASFGLSQNWQVRYEIPANIVDEQSAEEYINDTIGRNDMAVTAFPTYGKIANPDGDGTKLISMVGSIMGMEARFARNFDGYHKAAAGLDAVLFDILDLPDGFQNKVLDEEFLNPQGLNPVKKLQGNFVVFGDRTVGLDSAFRFKHQRETLSHYENVFIENFDFIIFALNNNETREQLRAVFIDFFIPELAKGAIVGEQLSDAVTIKIDDENNPESEQNLGNLHAEIGVRLVNTVERFIITISKLGVTEG